jgi:hypothetical protein
MNDDSKEDVVLAESGDGFKSRKFLLSVVVFITSTVVLAIGLITPDVWESVSTSIVFIYLTGNVAEKTLKRRS